MLIKTKSDLKKMVKAIEKSETIAFDTETTGLHLRHEDKVIGLSIYADSTNETYYLAWGHASGNVPQEWLDDVRKVWLKPALHVAHNAQFDLTAMHTLGFPLPNKLADTMAMLAVANPAWQGDVKRGFTTSFTMPDTGEEEKGSRGLKWQARLWGLENAVSGIEDLDEKVYKLLGKKVHNPAAYLWQLPAEDVAHYAEEDTRLTYLLYQKLMGRLDLWDEGHLYDLYNDMTRAAWLIQHHGFKLDVPEAQQAVTRGRARLAQIMENIGDLTDGQITKAGSGQQIISWFATQGVTLTNTQAETLSLLKDDHAVAGLLLEYRRLSKFISTYVQKWLDNAVQGHVHPELNVGGTASGRMSSSSPKFNNFQNIPRTDARDAFSPKMLLKPPDDHIILDLDYQALEMRLIAYVAETVIGKRRDMTLTNLIVGGEDMHAYTMKVAGIYDILLNGQSEIQYLRGEGFTDEAILKAYAKEHGHEGSLDAAAQWYFFNKVARVQAKTTNFSAVYGIGINGLARSLKVTLETSGTLLNGYHKAYPSVRYAQDFLKKSAMLPCRIKPDDVRSAMFVRYPVPEVSLIQKYHHYKDKKALSSAAWRAFSWCIQGIGGLMMQYAIVRIMNEIGFASYTLDAHGQRVYDYSTGPIVPHGTVHDSFIPSLRACDLHYVPRIIEIMTDFDVYPRLAVDVSASAVGGSWGSTRKVVDMDLWIKSQGQQGFAS